MKKLFIQLCAVALPVFSLTATATPQSIMQKIADTGKLANWQETSGNAGIPAALCLKSARNATLKTTGNIAEGPTLYGWMSYNEAWDKNQGSNYGIYSFPASANTSFSKVLGTKNISAGAHADGRLCAYYVLNYGGAISIKYYMYDADSGELKTETLFGTSNTPDIYTQYAYTLAYNYKDATLYGEFFRTRGDDLAVCISTVDPLTGAATEITEIDSNGVLFLSLAFDNDGNLYGIGDDGNLYTIALPSGTLNLIGYTGLRPKDPQGSAIDPASGRMFWSYLSETQESALYEVDLATGKANLASDYPATTWITGLYTDHTPTGGIPADITDMAVSYSANAALDCTVSFTAPATTADGNAATGSFNVDLLIDYNKIATAPATVNPGESYTFTTQLTAGLHKVEAQLSNNNGFGNRARILTYAGSDVAGAPGNVTLALDGRNATLTWTAPQKGANGGWFDATGLTYKIVRRPDNQVVATAYTPTSFTEEIPDELGNWFYEVTAVTTTEGATAESNRVMYGTSKKVPYNETFDTEAPMDLFITADVNGDGYFWKWKNGAVVDVRGDATDAADWIMTPPIALTTDWIYKMTFDAHAIGSFYTETFDAGFADTPDHESMNIIGSYSVTGEKWQTFEALVEVDKAADYHLGIRHSTLTTMRDELHIDNLQLLPFISTAAPASVDNLSVTLIPDNPLKGSLAFTAPVKAINGQPITEITKIEVMRGATILAEITDATPGKQFSMEVDVPQGVQEFNVICHNGNGRGHDSRLSSFGGIDIPQGVGNVWFEWDQADDAKATIHWEGAPAQGVHGIDINPSDLTYDILAPMWGMMMPSTTGLTTCSFEVSETPAPDTQKLVQRGVRATTKGGSSEPVVIYVPLGPAAPIDAAESFAGGSLTYPTWTITGLSGNARWSMFNSNSSITAQDDDNGYGACIAPEGSAGGEGRLVSPVFDFSSTQPAYLHIYIYHSASCNPGTSLTVEYTTTGGDFKTAGEPIMINDGSEGWQKHEISLAQLAGSRKAILGFRANLPDKDAVVAIDNLVIDRTSGTTSLIADSGESARFHGIDGAVVIEGAEGCQFSAYTPDGRMTVRTTIPAQRHIVPLPAGIYIVKADKTVAKVTVR